METESSYTKVSFKTLGHNSISAASLWRTSTVTGTMLSLSAWERSPISLAQAASSSSMITTTTADAAWRLMNSSIKGLITHSNSGQIQYSVDIAQFFGEARPG